MSRRIASEGPATGFAWHHAPFVSRPSCVKRTRPAWMGPVSQHCPPTPGMPATSLRFIDITNQAELKALPVLDLIRTRTHER
jgi:hypothetical protein